jgi:carboxyl-terminal processing protease
VATDPDFQYAAAEISAIDQMRKEKSVSLNLAKRKAEREQRSQEQLARENTRRAARGEPPLKAITDIKDPPDAILGEAAQITADLSRLEPRLVAKAPAPAGP